MATIPLPALHVNPPPDPMEGISRIMALKNMMQQGQRTSLENQQLQYNLGATQALNKSYQNAIKPDENGNPQIDTQALTKSLSDSGYGSQIPGVMEHVNAFNKSTIDLKTATADLQSKNQDILGSAAAAIKAANYDPKLAHTLLDVFPSNPQIQKTREMIDSNPDGFKQMIDAAIAQSPKQAEAAKNRGEAAQARYKVVNGALMDVSGPQPVPATGQNMQPADWMKLVDGVVPPTGSQASLNARTKQQVSFYVGNGNLEAAQKAITEAGQQVGAVEKETNPLVQQGKVNVAAAEGAARANIEHQFATMNNSALSTVPTHLVAPATAAAEKANKEWADAKSVSDRMAATMDAAKTGNVVSYQIIPEEGTLQITTSQGVHRINKTEIDQYAGGGSLWQRLQGHLGGALTGKSIPASVLKDMAEIQNIQAQGAQSRYKNTLASINQTYGSKFQPVEMGGLGGSRGPQVGAIEDGYRFKGGDASKSENWEKVKQ